MSHPISLLLEREILNNLAQPRQEEVKEVSPGTSIIGGREEKEKVLQRREGGRGKNCSDWARLQVG